MRKKELIDYDKFHSIIFSSARFLSSRRNNSTFNYNSILYKLKFNQKSSLLFSFSVRHVFLRSKENGRLFEPGNVNNHPHTKEKWHVYHLFMWFLGQCGNPINRVSRLPMDIFLTLEYLKNLDTSHSLWYEIRFWDVFFIPATLYFELHQNRFRFQLSCFDKMGQYM